MLIPASLLTACRSLRQVATLKSNSSAISFDNSAGNGACCGDWTGGGRIPLIAITKRAMVVRGRTPSNHCSLLATIQDGFGLAELPVQRNSTLKGFSIAASLAKRLAVLKTGKSHPPKMIRKFANFQNVHLGWLMR
jgi:hypothetical protein